MKTEHVLFEKKYDGEDLYDLSRDISEAIDEDYNPLIKKIPPMKDFEDFPSGTFTVSIVWTPDE